MNIEINEERQPTWEQMTEQGKGETRSNVHQVLGRLHKKAEEKREHEERHTIKVWKKIQEGEISARVDNRGNNGQAPTPKAQHLEEAKKAKSQRVREELPTIPRESTPRPRSQGS